MGGGVGEGGLRVTQKAFLLPFFFLFFLIFLLFRILGGTTRSFFKCCFFFLHRVRVASTGLTSLVTLKHLCKKCYRNCYSGSAWLLPAFSVVFENTWISESFSNLCWLNICAINFSVNCVAAKKYLLNHF